MEAESSAVRSGLADSFDFDVLDPTKVIPEETLAPVPVGRLVLDRMPDNFFVETEQVAFMTQNVPPGHRLLERSAAPRPQLSLLQKARVDLKPTKA
jgi:catalase